jgi:hypothetical protein
MVGGYFINITQLTYKRMWTVSREIEDEREFLVFLCCVQTEEEYRNTLLKISEPLSSNVSDLLYEDDSFLHYSEPPEEIDWRKRGAVTPVQDQVSQWLYRV